MRAKISVLGHFGEGLNLLNGQTVKTKIVTEELQNQFGKADVLKYDTHGGIKTLLKAPFQAFSALKHSSNVLIFPAHNGLRVYAPLLSALRELFKKRKIHYVVIGGWLPKFLLKHKRLAKSLRNFDGIYVETNTMKNALQEQGFENVFVMPNCKQISILSEDELIYPSDTPYKLCTFSRVMKEKGIEEAVEAVKAVNESLGYTVFSLDIYGQIASEQTDWFESLKKNFPDYVQYCGSVSFDKTVDVLKQYFILLFPTHYEGEGFAGTLIDAFSAGLPVVASDWKYNSEIVHQNVGFVYPTGEQTKFVDTLKSIASNPQAVHCKKKLCLSEAEKYRIEAVIKILTDQMETN